jgi:hypothetical protein
LLCRIVVAVFGLALLLTPGGAVAQSGGGAAVALKTGVQSGGPVALKAAPASLQPFMGR